MRNDEPDLGQNDAKMTDYLANIGKNIADKVSHSFHPVVEQYAQLFAHGDCTP
ncbi:MAG: hypothetical protein ACU4EQ_03840 [Candidatus Nitrosoglobus sp.]|jgi:hypothetical protein